MLLYAILYHWQLRLQDQRPVRDQKDKIDIKDQIELNGAYNLKIFQCERPFFKKAQDAGHLVTVQPYSKIYEFRSLDMRKIGEKFYEYKQNKNFDLALKSLRIKMIIEKSLCTPELIPVAPSFEATILALMADCEFQLASERAQ